MVGVGVDVEVLFQMRARKLPRGLGGLAFTACPHDVICVLQKNAYILVLVEKYLYTADLLAVERLTRSRLLRSSSFPSKSLGPPSRPPTDGRPQHWWFLLWRICEVAVSAREVSGMKISSLNHSAPSDLL